MPEDMESHDDAEVSDAASENDSERENEPDVLTKEKEEGAEMAQQKLEPDDENGSSVMATKPKLDPKDPLRPRRKKARRACFACQRAHLTCGDERPCQRCIKRGLADACQDGVRKKAKYLHDAPPEALRPVLGPTYNQSLNNSRSNNGPLSNSTSASDTSPGLGGSFFTQADTSPSYPIYSANPQSQMPPPLQANLSYGQQSPMSPTFQAPNSRRTASMQSIPQVPQVSNDISNSFGGALFDPSNPALFNFDLEGLNFGNHYGALEFGMLGHMSSGAAETPPQDKQGSISQQSVSDVGFNSFGNSVNQFGQIYAPDILPDFVAIDRQNSNNIFNNNGLQHGIPHAYAIATAPASAHSPSTDASPQTNLGFESPISTHITPHNHSQQAVSHSKHKKHDTKPGTISKWPVSVLGQRSRDPSSIYDTVHEPYPYTTGFHNLTAYVQRRFSANKTLRIAKSLASIRPSFISCTKTLNRQDLIFMEKCFQRTLFEYEDFMLSCCTPTLVCRRTGEVAAVNKEFTLLTGWKKDILLGKEANLNINTGRSGSGPSSTGNSGRAGLTTPRLALEKSTEGRPQPVLIAELLDDDSVIEFYEDFARLAFGDSRGSVTTRCKLLKYQPKDSLDGSGTDAKKEWKDVGNQEGGNGGVLGHKVSKIDGEYGIGRLERDGKMDCSYCWTVKRDVFDIPMLIVMNFLPCI